MYYSMTLNKTDYKLRLCLLLTQAKYFKVHFVHSLLIEQIKPSRSHEYYNVNHKEYTKKLRIIYSFYKYNQYKYKCIELAILYFAKYEIKYLFMQKN